eukprot:TRINITY_DN7983_c0_g1_i1.p1 TRINITY_DN7983_c0_g1~~TRINITY_DN7983_c0_g1_i1.p1  ORF type:complete len:314 (-),score=53.22 TRINITY_DN7983_c0_g1_i1:163-1032(-)
MDQEAAMEKRMRSLFTLKALQTPESVAVMRLAMRDPSVLLAHEAAYCLGQMRLTDAVPALIETLEDTTLNPMVRHESAEALGAIGGSSAVVALTAHRDDEVVEVRDTCRIALDLLEYQAAHPTEASAPLHPVFQSVDPAPALAQDLSVAALQATLLDRSLTIFERYRALFALRNLASKEAVEAICEALKDFESGAVFLHEIAYVLGQIQHQASVKPLQAVVVNDSLDDMVRHEAAEALGSIANDPETITILKSIGESGTGAVQESCVVALDINEYVNSEVFQYADGLSS